VRVQDGYAAAERSPSSRRWAAWSIFGFALAWVIVGSVLLFLRLAAGRMTGSAVVSQFALLPPAAAFSIVGLLVALRRPENPVGWLMLIVGAMWSPGVSPPSPEGSLQAWVTSPLWVPPFGIMGTHLLLRLPNGSLLSPRWRWVSRASTGAMLLTVLGFLFDPSIAGNPIPNSRLVVIALIGIIALAVCVVASLGSLIVRARRANAEERHQLRWIAAGGVIFVGMWLVGFVASAIAPSASGSTTAIDVVILGGYAAVPVGIGFAILKYRLFDIDIVIRKGLVVAVLAAFFVLVYALVVGGIGAAVGARGNATLSFLAAVIVAVLFQPVLARARRLADRVVYGKRATPYEVLSQFGGRLAETYAADDVLPRTARVLAEGVGADRARVWLRVQDELRPVATWPLNADPDRPDDHVAEVRHQGELLGALSVAMPANDPMDPAKEKLITDLAAQAGLVLRNVRLVEDVRASRRRLVAAADDERRKLERNIHDGAQQQLVALAIKARLASQLLDRDVRKASDILVQLEAGAREALEDLRDLARGIYPPLLADKGLVAALQGQARKSPVPVEIGHDGIGRYSQVVETAVYFSVLEALQNVGKYAASTGAKVWLAQANGDLRFEVRDDGHGFDATSTGYGTGLQGMADRLAALDGTLEVSSSPGAGTTVTGRIPLGPTDSG
jgi:signal transduction histidine kinase